MKFKLKNIHGDWFLLGKQEEPLGGEWKGHIMFDPDIVGDTRPNTDMIETAKEILREKRRNGIYK